MADGVKVGGVYTPYSLDISGLRRGVEDARRLLQQLRQEARQPIPAPGLGGTGGTPRAPRAPADDAARRERELRRLADSEIRAARAAGDHARALQLIERAMQAANGDAVRFNNLLAQQAQVSRAAAREAEKLALAQRPNTAGAQALDTFKQGLVGIVGPAALATAALAGLSATAQSFRDALEFKAGLDETRGAIAAQIRAVRDAGQAFGEAEAFAKRYKFSQEEITTALQDAIPILRSSTASTEQALAALGRLGATNPGEGIRGAAFALAELQSGDVQSLVERFRVSRTEAYAMRDAIRGGADAVAVLSDYLDRTGTGMDVLENRAKGAAGALRDLKLAEEELKLAQGEVAQAGIPLLGLQTSATRGLARVMRGELLPSFDEVIAKSNLYGEAYRAAFLRTGNVQQATIEALTAVANGTAVVTVAAQEAAPAVAAVSGAFTAAAASAQAAAERQTAYNAVARDTIALSAEDIIQKQQQGLATDRLTAFNRDLEAAALRVATGQSTQGQEAAALAAKYPELAGQIGAIISRQTQLAGTIEAANQKLREQQLLAQQKSTQDLTGGRGVGVGAPGTRGNDLADFDRFVEAQRAAEEARRRQSLALADTAGRVKLLRDELATLKAKGAAEADIIDKTTELRQAERQLAEESKKTGGARLTSAQRTGLQLQDIARTSADQIEQIERDHLQRMRDLQEDFEVRRARATEDYEQRRRKLLAEGKIFEAEQLRAEFEKDQRREREDFARDQARQQREVTDRLGDQGAGVDRRLDRISARTGAPAALPGVTGGAPAPLPSVPAPLPSAPGPTPPILLRIEMPTGTITMDGRAVGEVTWPTIERLLSEDLVRESATNPATLAAGASGPRP